MRIKTILCVFLLSLCTTASALSYQIIKIYHHSTSAFTQGLVINNGYLYESSGKYKKSRLNKYNIFTGKLVKSYKLPSRYFGEGIAIFGNKLYWLTYKSGTVFVLNKNTLQYIKSLHYQGEGWGLTSNSKQLIMSNGSSTIFFRDPEDFHIIRTIDVKNNNKAIPRLNELEFAQGLLFANIWHNNAIAIINPNNGILIASLVLTKLNPYSNLHKHEKVLNGIAYDKKTKLFFVTGKNWPMIYAIRITFDKSASNSYD